MLDKYNPVIYEEKAKPFETTTIKLPDVIKSVFDQMGIRQIYKHQAEAILKYRDGKDVVVVAPTSSGKTEVFITAAVEKAMKGEKTLIIYPTKALARDQVKRLGLFSIYGITYGFYDGDVSETNRKKVRENPPSILITNFDMLHHILLRHNAFSKFFKSLSLVVVDELHYYSGIFGSHASNIIRRLNRIMKKKYKRDIQYISTSATIGNPKEFAETMFNREVEIVEGKGNPRDTKYFLISPNESYISAALSIAEEIGKKTLIFGESHAVVERIAYIGKKRGMSIAAYRSGYPPDVRREIEKKFINGEISILSTTSALELGMDIGDVDVVILAGFPGAISRARQRFGRAGRRGQTATAVFIARENPLDVYYVEHPNEFFEGKAENVFINPNNEDILKYHVISMASEILLSEDEIDETLLPIVEKLENEGYIRKLSKFYSATKEGKRIIRRLGIRNIGERVRIYCGDNMIGERNISIAFKELYPGAVYFAYGKPYIVNELDFSTMKVYVEEAGDVDYYTTPIIDKEAEVIKTFKERNVGGINLAWVEVNIHETLEGYIIKEEGSQRRMGEHYYERHYTHSYNAHAFVLSIDPITFGDETLFSYGLHGYEHIFIRMTPAVAGNNDSELGGISYPSGDMFVYEAYPNGVGLAKIIFHEFERIAKMAHKRLTSCPCQNGCPKCILDPMCGNDNNYLDKHMAIEISKEILKNITKFKA